MSREPVRKPVTLEELLRVKRAEKPQAEFWSDWQKETNSKLRVVMIEKRPWWRSSLPRLWIAVARWHVPVGATALAALAFFSVREYQPALPAVAPSAPSAFASRIAQASQVETSTTILSELRQNQTSTEAMDRSTSGGIAGSVAMLTSSEESTRLSSSPAAKAIAANLAYARSVDPELTSEYSLPSAVFSTASVEEPLSRVPVARDMKRDRILASYQAVGSLTGGLNSPRRQDRIVSRLSEDQLYDAGIGRVGARPDRLSLKF